MNARLLSHRYELIEPIGRGATAIVWRARDHQIQRPVAVKVLAEPLQREPELRWRFRSEAWNAGSLDHPHIVRVYDFGHDDDVLYLVMELVQGSTLAQLLASGPLPVAEVVRIGSELLGALSHAHQAGVIHRDVKPSNILMAPDGHTKVADFGIARAINQASHHTDLGQLLGTAAYLSPEQTKGRLSHHSDLYTVGCVLYQCLAGRPAFRGETVLSLIYQHLHEHPPPLRSLRPEVPQALEQAIAVAMAKDPHDRFATAGEMRQSLLDRHPRRERRGTIGPEPSGGRRAGGDGVRIGRPPGPRRGSGRRASPAAAGGDRPGGIHPGDLVGWDLTAGGPAGEDVDTMRGRGGEAGPGRGVFRHRTSSNDRVDRPRRRHHDVARLGRRRDAGSRGASGRVG